MEWYITTEEWNEFKSLLKYDDETINGIRAYKQFCMELLNDEDINNTYTIEQLVTNVTLIQW